MAFNDYTTLKAEIATYMARTDLTNNIDTFIDMFEATAFRRLAIRTMEIKTTLNTVANVATVALPAGFRGIRSLVSGTSGGGIPIRRIALGQPTVNEIAVFNGGPAQSYDILNGNIVLYPTPSEVYQLTLRYYARFAPLSVAAPTNQLLTDHPDAYLIGSLLQGQPFIRDKDMIPVWKTMFDEIMLAIEVADAQEVYGYDQMRVALDLEPRDGYYGNAIYGIF